MTAIHYSLSLSQPHAHLYEVAVEVRGVRDPHVDLVMPVWTPGAYAVRDFAKGVQDFEAGPLRWRKVDKSRWRVFTGGASTVRATYRVWAYELEVDQSHLDGDHGYFNGASVFMYVDGCKHVPVTLAIRPPKGWKVVTGLDGGPTRFAAPSYDVLVDCPTEIGTSPVRTFRVRGKLHRVVIHGPNNWNEPKLVRQIRKLVEVQARMFGGLPYKHYTFIYHATVAGLGGLEHLNSTAMTLNPWAGRPAKQYERILEVTSHEFFHLWNVKRIRPKALGPFDYEREVYTQLLWLSEGITSYYDELFCVRAKLYDDKRYLKKVAEYIQLYRDKPSRLRQSLSQSSFDTWLWGYRTHPNNSNRTMSYYEKGALVGMCLDLEIRNRTRNRKSLDDVMRHLWREVAQKGRTIEEGEMPGLIRAAAGAGFEDFFARYIDGVEEVPFETFLRHAGLELKKEPAKTEGESEPKELAWAGVATRNGVERPVITTVLEGSPAQRDGLYPDDEILAVDNARVDNQNYATLLKDRNPGDRVRFSVFRGSRLVHVPVRLGRKANVTLAIVARKQAGAQEKAVYHGWLGYAWKVPKKEPATGS